MKRTITIFSLIIMLITAFQPVIAMHYCNDELSSLQIVQTNGIQDPCCEDAEHHDVSISNHFCCETEMIKVTTDDYQPKTEQPVIRISPLSTDIAGLTLLNQSVANEEDSDTLFTTLKFPTKGLYLEDVSIFTYICIYRI